MGETSTTRRVLLNGEIAEALERRYGSEAESRASRLASHFFESASLTPEHAAKAVKYGKLAAKQAEEQSAFAEAVRHLENCLGLITLASDGLGEDEAELLLELWEVAQPAVEWRTSWRTLLQAVTKFSERGDAIGQARAALAASQVQTDRGRLERLVDDALTNLGEKDAFLRAQLLYGRLTFNERMDLESSLLRELEDLIDRHGLESIRLELELSKRRNIASRGILPESSWDEHISKLESLVAAFTEAGDYRSAMDSKRGIVQAADRTGQLDLTIQAGEEANRFALEKHQRQLGGFVLQGGAGAHLARAEFESVLKVATRIPGENFAGDLFRAACALLQGAPQAAIDLLPASDWRGNEAMMMLVKSIRVRVLHSAGLYQEARLEFGAWRALLQTISSAAVYTFCQLDEVGLVLATETDLKQISSLLDEALDARLGAHGFGLDHLRGDIAVRLGNLDEARRHYETGREWAERERCHMERGQCHMGLADLARIDGDHAEAMRQLDLSGALFEAHGIVHHLDRVIAKKFELRGVGSGDTLTSIDTLAAAVQTEHPNLAPQAVPDGTVTLLFSDIIDSTAKNERLGDAAWMALLREHNEIIREQVAAHGGYEVKSMGAGFMLAFKSARDGLSCAIGNVA